MLVSVAVCLALCMVLPLFTGQIPQVGKMLSPMHIPVLLAGFLCGPWWALAVGAVAPPLRFVIFGMPAIFPDGTAMCFELAAYGFFCGFLYSKLPKKTVFIFVSMIAALIAVRILWGIARVILSGVSGEAFTWAAFMAGAFIRAVPGIILHIVLVPVIVIALQKAGIIQKN